MPKLTANLHAKANVEKHKFICHLMSLSIDGLALKLVSAGEQHSEAEDYYDKQRLSERYDFIQAYGEFCFGKHDFEKAIDKAIKEM